MATTKVKSPDGRVIKVRHPEGATQDEIIAYAQQNHQPLEQPKEQPEQDFSMLQTIKNIPSSAGNLANDLVHSVMNPIDTITGIGKTMQSGGMMLDKKLQGALPEKAQSLLGGDSSYYEDKGITEDPIKAVGKFYKDRYGSVDSAKQTLMKDPVGALFDASTVVSGAGSATRVPSISKAGAVMNPVNSTINAVKYGGDLVTKGAGKLIPESLPANMYESVAKFSTTLPEGQRAAMVRTALDNKIMPTSKGAAKLDGMIKNLNTTIDDLISTAQAQGKTIPKAAIYKNLKGLRDKKGGVRLDASSDLQSIDDIVRGFESHLKSINKKHLTPKDLQDLKVSAYQSINFDAKRMKGSPIKEDTYKSVARGAKEGLEQLSPNIGPTNKKLGSLYELQPHLQRSAGRIDNRNLIPIDAPMQVGVGGVLANTPGAIAGGVTTLLGNPKIKAATALKLQKMIDSSSQLKFPTTNVGLSNAEIMSILGDRQATENN